MNEFGNDPGRGSAVLSRRSALRLGLGAAAALTLEDEAAALGREPEGNGLGTAGSAPVVFADVDARARTLAAGPFVPAPADLPPTLAELSYDAYQAIRFRADARPSLGRRFSAQFFHRGFLFRRRIAVFVQRGGGGPEAVAYDAAQFTFGPGAEPAIAAGDGGPAGDLGFAGFRLHYAFDAAGSGRQDEFLVFLGASYFRLRADGQTYGLSARGVCVNTGAPGGEEFPAFTCFWINEPEGADEETLTVLALLEGPSLAGAFQFRVRPGKPSRIEVTASLHLRRDVARLGLAPLTSMFLYGEPGSGPADAGVADDFRPKVHDSDGLLVAAGEERIWRPLTNHRAAPHTSSFRAEPLAGFGLLQRERTFTAFLDVQARYEARPGLWVQPKWDAGPAAAAAGPAASVAESAELEPLSRTGAVQLYEIPSRDEYLDNVVAAFVPDEPARAGRTFALTYELATVGAEPVAALPSPLAHVARTRVGSAERLRPMVPPAPGRRLFVVDFEGPGLPADPAAAVVASVSASAGTLVEPVVERVPQTGGWRLYVEFRPPEPKPDGDTTIRARLDHDGRPVTETWCAVA